MSCFKFGIFGSDKCKEARRRTKGACHREVNVMIDQGQRHWGGRGGHGPINFFAKQVLESYSISGKKPWPLTFLVLPPPPHIQIRG